MENTEDEIFGEANIQLCHHRDLIILDDVLNRDFSKFSKI